MIPLAPYDTSRATRVRRLTWARFWSLQHIPNPIRTRGAYLIKGYTAKISAALLGLLGLTAGLQANDLTTGLIAHYPFDGNASDVSGNNNHGTNNGATPGTGRLGNPGKGFNFDGVDDEIELGNLNFGNPITGYAYSFWMRHESVPAGGYATHVINKPNLANNVQDYMFAFYLFGNSDSSLTGVARHFGTIDGVWGSADSGQEPFYRPTVNTWHHYAISYDGSQIVYYVDGTSNTSAAKTGNAKLNSGSIYAGGKNTDNFDGDLDELRFYDRALSASDVLALYNLEKPNPPPPGASIAITSPVGNADQYSDLQVSITYQSGGGGYQTPTWAYRIDSPFPGYASPHGGTVVSGTNVKHDFLSGQGNGQRQVYVTLLDQSGYRFNPPVNDDSLINYQYQSGGGGYQSGGGGYQSGGGGYQSGGGGYQSGGGGYQSGGGGYQSGDGGYQSGDGGYQSGDGNGTQPDPTERFIPVVDTLPAENVAEASASLRGKIEDDGGATITERGFLLSARPNPKPGNPDVQRLDDANGSTNFRTDALNLQPGKKYFYRAFATNAKGTSLGSVETFKTSEQYSGPWWIYAQPTVAKDWWRSHWFGNFYLNTNGWARHEKLGWVYPMKSPTSGLWLWKKDIGWLWTAEGIYPYLFDVPRGGWLYFFGQHEDALLFYDYSNKRWVKRKDGQ